MSRVTSEDDNDAVGTHLTALPERLYAEAFVQEAEMWVTLGLHPLACGRWRPSVRCTPSRDTPVRSGR